MPFDNTSQFTTETNGGAPCSAEHVTSVIMSRVYTSCYFIILLNLLQEKKVLQTCALLIMSHVNASCPFIIQPNLLQGQTAPRSAEHATLVFMLNVNASCYFIKLPNLLQGQTAVLLAAQNMCRCCCHIIHVTRD